MMYSWNFKNTLEKIFTDAMTLKYTIRYVLA